MYNVGKTIINHPPRKITIYRGYVYHSQSWVVYDIVFPTLDGIRYCIDMTELIEIDGIVRF